MHVELTGFRPLTREGVGLATGETVRVDLQMQLGGLSESVTVSGDASLLRSQTSSLGQVVDNKKVVALPLNGRSFISLAGLAPGVALPPGSSLPRINGGRPRTNEYLFDGISVLQPEPGQVAFFPNIDAIQEFKIESNSPPAEFGRFNGGVVNLTTKAGSNALHGTVFEFLRNEALNARNFFATSSTKPEFRRNQFGGVVGGPIKEDRTFFFADYQGQRQTIGRPVISTVPTILQRQGIFTEAIGTRVPSIFDPATTHANPGGGATRTQFPGNTIPGDRIDPVAGELLAHYPLPTSAGTANNYRRLDNETVDQNQFNVRVDHHFPGNRDQVFGRLTRFQENFIPVTPFPDGSGVVTIGALGPQKTAAWAFASSYQRIFSNGLFNELRIGDTSRAVTRSAANLDGPAFVQPQPAGHSVERAVSRHVADISHRGLPAARICAEHGERLQHERHTGCRYGDLARRAAYPQAGGDLRWERLNVIQPPSPTGSFTFSNLFTDQPGVANTGTPFASFLLGQVQQFSIDLQQSQIRNRAHFMEYFVQDDWRVTDRLTVNAGRSLHPELSVDRREQSGRGLQSRDEAAGVPRTKRPAACGPRAPQVELRSQARRRRSS